jgi:hypothetical protein
MRAEALPKLPDFIPNDHIVMPVKRCLLVDRDMFFCRIVIRQWSKASVHLFWASWSGHGAGKQTIKMGGQLNNTTLSHKRLRGIYE